MAATAPSVSLLERLLCRLGWLEAIPPGERKPKALDPVPEPLPRHRELSGFPPPEKWADWVEWDAKREAHRYHLVPTTCFNCEAACGLLAFVDKESLELKKVEGNPLHPGSRGRNCAKGPATVNQVKDPERILYPLKRAGKRGEGKWERVPWQVALDDIGLRIRAELEAGRRDTVMYHVGRPGHERFMDRVLQAWGVDGHNSHTNVCSAAARTGYALWSGYDRPSPDHAEAKFILLVSSHLEAGHYFNPHAQRIIEGKRKGAKLCVVDVRLSNTASMADHWLAPRPGTEAALLLAIAHCLLRDGTFDRGFVRRWVNWEETLATLDPARPRTFDAFVDWLREQYARFTPGFAQEECGVKASLIETIAGEIARAAPHVAAHVWRSAASGNLGGWQVARCLFFLNVLTGSVGAPGGTAPSAWHKWRPRFHDEPEPQAAWNELLFPREWPLSHYEMSYLLPYLLREGRGPGRLAVYFTRVYNPVWTNPDGFAWIEMLRDEAKVGLHVALTPTWNETAVFADYVLPMGHGTERHDVQSQETQSSVWVSFRQPVRRVAKEAKGETVDRTWEANPGEVGEEDEFWIDLSWRIDPDGALNVRKHFESPYRPGEKLKVREYYRWVFENAVPGLPEAARELQMTPLEYMQRRGAFEVKKGVYAIHDEPVAKGGVEVEGVRRRGFPTPSGRLEVYSRTLAEWGWPEQALPGYIPSHLYDGGIDEAKGEMVLVPTFRLPQLIHTRSGNAKWLNELAHRNPLLLHPQDAARLKLATNDLVRVNTEIGYFVAQAYVTEGIRPGVAACSHHLGRWRLRGEGEGSRWSAGLVEIREESPHVWRLRPIEGVKPFSSDDPDSRRVWWSEAGVHQNLAFPVHPDPVSGMHCWHQKVRLEKAWRQDRAGDVSVDTKRSQEVYERWKSLARPGPGPDGLRRPPWLNRPVRPAPDAFRATGGAPQPRPEA